MCPEKYVEAYGHITLKEGRIWSRYNSLAIVKAACFLKEKSPI